MRKPIAGLLLVLVVALVGVGGYYYVAADRLQPQPVPQAILDAESALAMDGAAAIFHVDVQHMVAVEDAILGGRDDDALPAVAMAEGFVGQLLGAGVDARQAIDHVVATMVPGPDGYGLAGVMTGRFDRASTRLSIAQHFDVQEVSIGGASVLLLSRIDPRTCRPATPRALHISADRIVIAAPETMAALLARLDGGAPAATDLSAWRAFRAGRLLSAAILMPMADLAASVDDPMAQTAVGAIGMDLAPLGPAYFGVSFETLPTRLLLEGRVVAQESGWAAAQQGAYTTWRGSVSAEFAERVPALVRLTEHLQIVADDDTLVAQLPLSQELFADAGAVPGEVLTLMFRGAGIAIEPSNPQPAPAEQILPAEEIPAFRDQVSAADLVPFDPQLDFSFADATTVGPFAVRLDGFRLTQTTAPDSDGGGVELVEIEFAALSGEIPNMTSESLHNDDERPRAALTIASVHDAAGNELLRAEACGPERNEQSAALQSSTRGRFVDNDYVQVPVVWGAKKVRLAPGVQVSEIASIAGEFELRLPTEVETVTIEAPFAGQVVARDGVRIKMQAQPGTASGDVTYDLSGDIDRVLAVHALNAQGQYLRGGGGHASGRVLGDSKTVSKSFMGVPAAVRFVIAAREEVVQIPFELTDVAPHFDRWDRPEPFTVETATADDIAAHDMATVFGGACADHLAFADLGAFRVCVDSFDLQWGGLTGRWQVLAPDHESLNGNLSAAEIAITSVRGIGGDTDIEVSLSQFLRFRDVYDAAYLEDTPWLQAVAPEALAEATDFTIGDVRGTLAVRVPTRLEALSLPVTALGARAEHASGLTARLVGFENGGLRLDLMGPRDRVVQFVPRDSEGVALATNNARIDATDEAGRWSASLSVSGRPHTLDIIVAVERDEVRYPFELTLDRGSR